MYGMYGLSYLYLLLDALVKSYVFRTVLYGVYPMCYRGAKDVLFGFRYMLFRFLSISYNGFLWKRLRVTYPT